MVGRVYHKQGYQRNASITSQIPNPPIFHWKTHQESSRSSSLAGNAQFLCTCLYPT